MIQSYWPEKYPAPSTPTPERLRRLTPIAVALSILAKEFRTSVSSDDLLASGMFAWARKQVGLMRSVYVRVSPRKAERLVSDGASSLACRLRADVTLEHMLRSLRVMTFGRAP